MAAWVFLGIAARTVVVIALGGDDNERLCVLVSFPLTLSGTRGGERLSAPLYSNFASCVFKVVVVFWFFVSVV